MERNAESSYTSRVESTASSTLDESYLVRSLIQRVEEFQRKDYFEALDKLTTETRRLHKVISHYQDEWCSTLDLLQQTEEILLSIRGALERCFEDQMEAERYWASSWRIQSDGPSYVGYNATGWI
jgi:hypothetical protein